MAAATLRHPREHLMAPEASGLRTAFVLSGGASLGALQVGMLEALYEHDIVPDMLVGSSAGALNAAFVASRPQTTATAKALSRIWRNLQREDIFPVSMSALVGGLCGRRDHLIPDRGLRQLARRYIEFDDLADTPIPLHLVAFDLVAGRELSLSEGPAVDSVVAASSIPDVFPPVAMGDRRLIDGGVVNNTPFPTPSNSAPSGSTSCRHRIRHTVSLTAPRRPLPTPPSTAFVYSSTAGLRPTSSDTRQRPS
jgi:NTE family protein